MLKVENLSKHYNNKYLFKDISFELKKGESIAIKGKNGSGKSTLLQIIYGLVEPNEGEVLWNNHLITDPHLLFSFTSPAMLLPVEFSLNEWLTFIYKMNLMNLPQQEFEDELELSSNFYNKPMKSFSSGMLQRIKTGFCLFQNKSIKILDEPISNLDNEGINWYLSKIEKLKKNNIFLFAGNQKEEVDLADRFIVVGEI